MEQISIILWTILLCALATQPRTSKRYRSDYQYNHKTDAFYKFHPEPRQGFYANSVCEIEGAKLMLIENEEDLMQAHGMLKKYPDLPEYAWVEPDGQTHESTEEKPIIDLSQLIQSLRSSDQRLVRRTCDVVTRAGQIEYYPCFEILPFFCKVKASEAYYDSRCQVFGTNYKYIQAIGSCYKVPETAYSWNEAYAECRAEGSHLLVLNSLAESQAMQNLTRTSRPRGTRFPWFFFAGYRAEPPKGNETLVFKTIFNQTLAEAGFHTWSPNEPNNVLGNELCGSFFRNDGKLNDVNCVHQYGFICEKEIQS